MGQIVFQATLGGQVAVSGPNTASSFTLTLPAATDTLVGKATTDTLTNKTLTSPVISGGTINNATIGATTATTGAFTTLSATGVATFSAGTVSLPAITTTGDTNTGIFFPAADTIAFTEGGVESLRITSAGDVGIGTNSPSVKLHVDGTGTQYIKLSSSTNSNFIQTFATSGSTGQEYKSVYRFVDTDAGERMRIDSSGNVGIGATSAGNKLQISNGGANGVEFDVALASGTESKMLSINRTSSAYTPLNYDASLHKFFISGGQKMQLDASGNLLVGKTAVDVTTAGTQLESTGTVGITRDSATNLILNRKTSDGTIVSIRRDNTEVGSISATTTLTSYNTTSDQRLKTNIVDAPLGNIDSIKVRSFDWIADNSHQEYGMVAQELIEVAPYAVHQPQNPDEMMAVDYSKLVPMMIREIQDLRARLAKAGL